MRHIPGTYEQVRTGEDKETQPEKHHFVLSTREQLERARHARASSAVVGHNDNSGVFIGGAFRKQDLAFGNGLQATGCSFTASPY